MPSLYEIRADYDPATIVVYQAFSQQIAEPALRHGTFVAPFSLQRMTWIKPSFLWLMERSNWGRKAGQEHILAVRLSRQGWEEALAQAVLTHPDKRVYRNRDDWKQQFENAPVHVQWDPERSRRGQALNYYSLQVGLSRQVIQQYVSDWVVEIRDYTPLAKKLSGMIAAGNGSKAKSLLPHEAVYPLNATLAKRLGM